MKEIKIERDATVKNATRHKDDILAALTSGDDITIDLSSVKKIDLSFAQILYAAQLEGKSRNCKVALAGLNKEVKQQLIICGIIKN